MKASTRADGGGEDEDNEHEVGLVGLHKLKSSLPIALKRHPGFNS
jgi:hypothetical protein